MTHVLPGGIFTPNAAEAGIASLKQGVPIVADTNAAKAGISRSALEQLGSAVHCLYTI